MNDNRKIYNDEQLSFYTEDIMRGSGVLEINLNSNEFEILNLDSTTYEKFTFFDDFYIVENKIENIVARKVIFNVDFFCLIFDCELFKDDDEFVFIYINSLIKKIKKLDYVLFYSNWEDYVKNEYIKLNKNNLLKVETSDGNKSVSDSINHIYIVKKMVNDKLELKSTSTGCCKCTEDIEGTVIWRDGNKLLINICVID